MLVGDLDQKDADRYREVIPQTRFKGSLEAGIYHKTTLGNEQLLLVMFKGQVYLLTSPIGIGIPLHYMETLSYQVNKR